MAKAGGSELTGLVSIRGVSQNDFTAHLESPNALYIDDYYQPSAANGVQQFYDVERIEVLKGPQGTLFGRNATGGLLNVFTREPENHFEGYVTGTLADYDEMGLKGAGEEVCAAVRLREGATANVEEIITFCRGQIAHYKVPRYVRFVDAFPLTVTGKVQKYLLRERIEAELGVRRERTA